MKYATRILHYLTSSALLFTIAPVMAVVQVLQYQSSTGSMIHKP